MIWKMLDFHCQSNPDLDENVEKLLKTLKLALWIRGIITAHLTGTCEIQCQRMLCNNYPRVEMLNKRESTMQWVCLYGADRK